MRNKIYICFLTAAMCACSSDVPQSTSEDLIPKADETGMMIFMPRAATLSRASSNGYYNQDYYPVNSLFLTAYHRDSLKNTQWYFQDVLLKASDANGQLISGDDATFDAEGNDTRYWKANGWYWPIQGKMEFLSYWSPKVYGEPQFYEYTHADGSRSAQMVVNARGVMNGEERYEGLDGYTDFLYIAQKNIPCPQVQPLGLTYKHGLSWLTVSLQAIVPLYDGDGNAIPESIDVAKTNELIDKVKVKKIVIEDLSRKGTAYLVPGLEVAWIIHPDDIKDQVYTRPETATDVPRGNYSSFTWHEEDDGRSYYTPEYVTLSSTKQYLGLYRPKLYDSDPDSYKPDSDHSTEYVGNGLLVIPQHKTSITVYFLIKGGRLVFDENGDPVMEDGVQKTADLEVAEKFDLHDNDLEWSPGKRYQYDIKFTSTVEDLKDKFKVVLVESTYELKIDPVSTCYDKEAFGQLVVTDGAGGTTVTSFKAATFVLDPLHNEGSPFFDEMDYFDGGQVF